MGKISEMRAVRIAAAVKKKELSAREVVESFLKEIEEKEKHLNCYITVDADGAFCQAEQLQKKINAGEAVGALAGVPAAVKDNLCVQGMRTTCASKMLENFMPPYTAEAVKRLQKSGAILLGKTNMDEFSMGNTTETSYFGAVKNPWNPEYAAGGSSGGSAAAAAAHEACVALGTDTGGSVRQPAACCGVVGVKPTYGTVSRSGLISYASSMDQVGSIASDVTDAALLLEAVSGYDAADATSVRRKEYGFDQELGQEIRGMRIGIPKDYLEGKLQPEISEAVARAAGFLKEQGAEVETFEIGLLKYAPPAYYVIAGAEVSSNLARYDGVKYGYRAAEYDGLSELYEKSRLEGFGAEARSRIAMGTLCLSHDFYETYYLQAMKIRRLMKQSLDKAFGMYDLILGPVMPMTAPKIGNAAANPVESYWNDMYTVAANLAGIPALSLPFGRDGGGLPVGIQLMADCFQERKLLRCAYVLEKCNQGEKENG